jgi:hypothetical protein
MTDDEAKRLFSPAIEFALDPTLPNDARETIRAGCRFALQAIADRQALVAAVSRLYECKSAAVGEPAIWWADNEAQRVTGEALDAARRHMRGEE